MIHKQVKQISMGLTLCLSVLPVWGQHTGNYNYSEGNYNASIQPQATANIAEARFGNPNEIIWDFRALSNVQAKSYLAIFNLTQLGGTAAEANQILKERFDAFAATAKDLGIPEGDIYLDLVSSVPKFEYEVEKKLFSKKFNEVPKGIQIQANIHIKYTDRDILDELVAAAANSEIYDLAKVEYFVEGTNKRYRELREAAIEEMKVKIESFKQMGIVLDTVSRIVADAQAVIYPHSRYAQYTAFCSTSLDAIKSQRNVTKVEKQVSRFFNKLPYEPFDIILNPEFTDPPVQFTYHLKVKFTLKQPAPKTITVKEKEKEILWLTPQGTVQKIKVE